MKVFDYTPEFNKTELANGVVIVTEHHPYTRATCAGVFVQIGARDESSKLSGAAHFLEHLVFKGTKNRTALQIAQSLEAVGGDLNAYTTREYTCFHTTSLREHLDLSLDILSDLTFNAQFSTKEFNKEREVVLQEIDMSAEQYEEYIFDLFYEETFKGHKLHQPILGTEKSISKMKKADITNFYKDHYCGANIILAIAGDVNHSEVVKNCKKIFGKKKAKAHTKRQKPKKLKPFVKHIPKPSEQMHILMGFPSVSYKSKERFDAYMLNAILGGGMTSRLYQRVREKNALAYSVYSYLHTFTDSGSFSLYAGTSKDKTKEVVDAFYTEVESLHKKGVSKKELNFFKKQVQGQIVLSADDIENRMTSLAVNQMVFKKYRPVEKVLAEIEAVNIDSMKEYIEKYMNFDQLSLMTLGES